MYAQTSAGFFARISEIMERTKIYKASATNIHRASPVKAVSKLKFSKNSSISHIPLGCRHDALGARACRTSACVSSAHLDVERVSSACFSRHVSSLGMRVEFCRTLSNRVGAPVLFSKCQNALDDVILRHAVFFLEFIRLSGFAESILLTHHVHLNRAVGRHHFRNC